MVSIKYDLLGNWDIVCIGSDFYIEFTDWDGWGDEFCFSLAVDIAKLLQERLDRK